MAVSAQGMTIGVSAVVPGVTYTQINCVNSISKDDVEAATIDVTCLASTSKQKILGLSDNGSITLELFVDFNDAGYKILETLKASGDKGSFEITMPLEGTETVGRKFTFNGLVKTLPWAGAVDAAVSGSATIEIDGDVTETPPVTT